MKALKNGTQSHQSLSLVQHHHTLGKFSLVICENGATDSDGEVRICESPLESLYRGSHLVVKDTMRDIPSAMINM
jgi:hypothetical protein